MGLPAAPAEDGDDGDQEDEDIEGRGGVNDRVVSEIQVWQVGEAVVKGGGICEITQQNRGKTLVAVGLEQERPADRSQRRKIEDRVAKERNVESPGARAVCQGGNEQARDEESEGSEQYVTQRPAPGADGGKRGGQ